MIYGGISNRLSSVPDPWDFGTDPVITDPELTPNPYPTPDLTLISQFKIRTRFYIM
jgi:hypothetical protein